MSHFTCRSVTELLIEYVEGTMPDDERATLQRHLCGCIPCAIYLRTYRDTIQLTHRLPDEPIPAEFASRLQAMLKEECG
jgi:anti-sigma factor RsiW